MKQKSIITFLVCLFLLTDMSVFALQEGVRIPSVKAKEGETVRLSVILDEKITAKTIGISMKFDHSVLEFMASLSSWSVSGSMQNFDRQKDAALWTDSKATALSGELCRVAFRIKDGKKASQSKVSFSIVFKTDDKTVATYEAEGEITADCSHDYGDWESEDNNSHSRVCKLCNQKEFKAHNWDSGVIIKMPTKTQSGLRKFTCSDCGAQREIAVTYSELQGDTSSNAEEAGCVHKFTAWSKYDDEVHIRTCELCGKKEYQEHSCDNGVLVKEDSDSQAVRHMYTCLICGAKHYDKTAVSVGSGDVSSTQSHTHTNYMSSPESPSAESHNHDHSGSSIVNSEAVDSQSTAAENEAKTASASKRQVIIWIVVAVLGCLVIGGTVFCFKKHR